MESVVQLYQMPQQKQELSEKDETESESEMAPVYTKYVMKSGWIDVKAEDIDDSENPSEKEKMKY